MFEYPNNKKNNNEELHDTNDLPPKINLTVSMHMRATHLEYYINAFASIATFYFQ